MYKKNIMNDEGYAVDWEDTGAQEVRSTIPSLTKGCTLENCGCKKKLSYSGPGCECQCCINLPKQQNIVRSEDDRVDDYSKSEGSDLSHYT